MIARGSGKIVFTASLLTFQGGITVPGYAGSKGGIGSLIKALANEWASKGVNVNGIAPGYIATELLSGVSEEVMKSIVGQIPVGRIGEPEDVARCVTFLAADEANWITGSTLTVNGGALMD